MENDRRQERIHLVAAILLFAVPTTADQLIFAGCGGICAVDPIPGATPAPLIPGLNDAVEEAQTWWRNEVLGVVNQDLSPDGHTLAIIMLVRHTVEATDIWTINTDGTDLKILLRQERYFMYHDKHGNEIWDIFPASLFGMSWSPEGGLLAYTDALSGREFSGFSGINYLIPGGTPPDSVSHRKRTYFHSTPAGGIPGGGWSLDWHPDGRLFYARGGSVRSIDRDGSNFDVHVRGYNPAVSPDGRVVYARETYVGEDSLFVRGSDGGYIGRGCCPTWSPDSQRIAYFADGYLRVMNADGSGQIDICPAEYKESSSSYYSPDLDWIGEPEIPTAIRESSWGTVKREIAGE